MVITKQFSTETSHIVRMAFSERCKYSVHGHKYVYEVSINGPIDPVDGMVLDFKRLSNIKNFIDMMDHATVLWSEESDEVKDFFTSHFHRVLIMKKNPTAENMVRLINKFVSDWLNLHYPHCKLVGTRIWETTTGSASGSEFDDGDVFSFINPPILNEKVC